jgi:SP family myo-inositol transporter-like MFS transporter 13
MRTLGTAGIISGAMLLIIIDLGLEGKTIEQEIIVSSTLVGCIMGSIISKTLTERWGRRSGILVAAAIFTVGAGIMAGARWTFDVFGFLVLGRVVVGVGVGLASMVTPLYLTEVAPAHIRGRLVSMNIVFVTFGSFVAAVVAASLSKYVVPP